MTFLHGRGRFLLKRKLYNKNNIYNKTLACMITTYIDDVCVVNRLSYNVGDIGN